MKLAEMLEQHNVSFVSVTQEINTSTSAGRMMLNILMTFAEFERDLCTERVRFKIEGAKKRGKHCGGFPVLGYDSDPKTKSLVVNEEEAKLVRHIFERYCQVGSARQVAKELNEQGRRSKSWTTQKGKFHEGMEFKPDLVYRMLKNPLYNGNVTHKDKIFPGEQKAIVKSEIWKKAQELLSGNLAFELGRKTETVNPLKNLLKCGHCGGSMGPTYTQKKEKRYVYYICETDAKRAVPQCPIKRVPAGDMEKIVLKQLSEIFKSPSLLAQAYFNAKKIEEEEKKKLREKCDRISAEYEKLKKEMVQALQSDSKNNHNVKGEFEKSGRALEEAESALRHYVSNRISNEDIINACESIDSLWEELFPVERYRLLHLLIEKITVFTDGFSIELNTNGMNSLTAELVTNENKEED
jgi:site-specific DNA recombinase